MKILNLIAGEKWTGTAAVVFDQTAALVAAGLEAQFGFVRDSLLASRLLSLGWTRPLFERPPRGPFAYVRDVRLLRETILRERFDLVHAHGSHDHSVAAAALSGTRIPLLRTIHHLRHARRTALTRSLFDRTTAFAFANRAIASAFGPVGPVHPPVVDIERFQPGTREDQLLRRFDLPENDFLVGTVGKVAAGRGHAEAIAATSPLKEIATVHVGHGELLPALRRRAAELGAQERNFWVGYQEELLPDFYRSWDAFLFTASGSEQGQRAVLEAMASGLPVVALDLPGVRDLVTDGREGFVVESVAELTDRLGRLAQEPDLRAEMSGNARERGKDFTAEKFVAKAREFYEGIARFPSARRSPP